MIKLLFKNKKIFILIILIFVVIKFVIYGVILMPYIDNVDANNKIESNIANNISFSIEKVKLVRVVDGDTIIVVYNSKNERVRLVEINCEESVEEAGDRVTEKGKQASEFTSKILENVEYVYLTKDKSDRDKYGRLLRLVWLEKPIDVFDEEELKNKCLNAILLINGYAKVVKYDDDSYVEIFKKLEKQNK